MRRGISLLALLVPLAMAAMLGRCQAMSPATPTPAPSPTTAVSSGEWMVYLSSGTSLRPADPEPLQDALQAVLAALQAPTGPGVPGSQLASQFPGVPRAEVRFAAAISIPTQYGNVMASGATIVGGQSGAVLLQVPDGTWVPYSLRDPKGDLLRAFADAVNSETGVRMAQSDPTPGPAPQQTASLFIKIAEPAPGTHLNGSVTVRGRAGAIFENQFEIALLDASGARLAESSVTVDATAPGGAGPFEVTLTWDPSGKTGAATLWAYERSPKDGTISAQDTLSVWLGQ